MRKTGENVTITNKGVYGQAEIPVTSMFKRRWRRALRQARLYDAQWSPKAALLVTPVADQTFRVTFNRAFKSPTILQTSFFFPDFQPFIGVFGNATASDQECRGHHRPDDRSDRARDQHTWEAGYKGILGTKLFVDVVGYARSSKLSEPAGGHRELHDTGRVRRADVRVRRRQAKRWSAQPAAIRSP